MSTRTFAFVALVVLGASISSFMFGSAFAMKSLTNLERDLQKKSSQTEENQRIYVIVGIPDDLITGNEKLDHQRVINTLLSKNEADFKLVTVERGFKYHGYFFYPK